MSARPFYAVTSGGQVRQWIAGAAHGPVLVVLPGLMRSAASVAENLARECSGWTVVAVELPGIGYSSGIQPKAVADVARILAESLSWIGKQPIALAAFDLSLPLAMAMREVVEADIQAVFSIDHKAAIGWHAAGIHAPSFELRQDGGHLLALWAFLRDRHLLVPDDLGMPDASPRPMASLDALSDAFVCAAQRPDRFAGLWSACIGAIGGSTSATIECSGQTELAGNLARLHLPVASLEPPQMAPVAGGGLWHHYVETTRGRRHLRRAGETGKPLLVIPTGGGSSAQFAPVVTGLARNRRVFAVDYPGNGLSEPSADKVTIGTLALDMLALLDAMDIGTCDVWGSHTGAQVALEMAVIAPDRIGRIVMEGPVFVSPDFQADLLANYFIDLTPDQWGRHILSVWNWRRDMFMYWPWYNVARETARKLGVPSAEDLHMYALGILESGITYDQAYRSAFGYDTRARLKELERPALICAGPNDQLRNALDEAPKVAPPGLVSYATTPTTVWWPNPDPVQAQATLELYDLYLNDVQVAQTRAGEGAPQDEPGPDMRNVS